MPDSFSSLSEQPSSDNPSASAQLITVTLKCLLLHSNLYDLIYFQLSREKKSFRLLGERESDCFFLVPIHMSSPISYGMGLRIKWYLGLALVNIGNAGALYKKVWRQGRND